MNAEESALAKAYADFDDYCEKSADCTSVTLGECKASFLTQAEVERALKVTEWGERSPEDCRLTVKPLDECLLELSCSEYRSYSVAIYDPDSGWQCFDTALLESGATGDVQPVDCPERIPCGDEQEALVTACRPLDRAILTL